MRKAAFLMTLCGCGPLLQCFSRLAGIMVAKPLWVIGFLLLAASINPSAAADRYSEGDEKLPVSVSMQLDRLAPQRPGLVDFYAVLVGADGSEAVFDREVQEVKTTLEERLDIQGRIVTLVNRKGAAAPQATLKSLSQTIAAVASRMDVEEDILFLHITTHGSSDHILTFKHMGHQLYGLNSKYLANALDEARIRFRVLVVSACYAGGFVAPFANGNTLAVAAASATSKSYGCGNDSLMTDFSRAFYSNAMRQQSSIVLAARQAVRIIQEEERVSKREHSYPQVHVGPVIAEKLRKFEEQVKVARQTRLRARLGLPAQ